MKLEKKAVIVKTLVLTGKNVKQSSRCVHKKECEAVRERRNSSARTQEDEPAKKMGPSWNDIEMQVLPSRCFA